jgi:basic membrane protein A and related proteins
MNHRTVRFLSLLVVLSFVLISCAPAATQPPAATQAPAPTQAPVAAKLTVGMVTSGSLGDNGIFDLAAAGLDRAKKDLGIDFKILEGKEDPSLYFNLLETAAQNYPMVLVNPGYQFSEALKQIAPKYPKTIFVYMDGASDVTGDNIASMATQDNEGSYLAGILAGGMTLLSNVKGINADKAVGLVGAIDAPVINNFIAGFKGGVASIDPAITVTVLYAGTFSDPAKGKELTTSLYSQKNDVVFNVAAQTGQGVLLAAKETGHYAIGVDTDQCALQPGSILASMEKRFDNTTYTMVKAMVDGKLKGGQVYSYGLKDGGVELKMCTETKDVVPTDLVQKINDAQAKIVSGGITVPSVK